MSRLSYNTVIRIIKNHIPWINDCIVTGGFDEYNSMYAHVRHIHDKTTRAGIIQDHIINHARMTIPANSNITIIERNQLFLLKISHKLGDVAIRFKKFNELLLSSNVHTQQSADFCKQMEMDFIKKSVHLNAGYTVDNTGSLNGCYITCPLNNDHLEWHIQISASAAGSAPNIIQLPLNPPPTNPRVTVKKEADKKSEEKDEE